MGYYTSTMISDLKRRALHRSKIIQGQMKGLEKMIEKEAYCMDILTQSLAMQKSLASLNKLILENHLKTHVAENLREMKGKAGDRKIITELLDLYELNNVRSK